MKKTIKTFMILFVIAFTFIGCKAKSNKQAEADIQPFKQAAEETVINPKANPISKEPEYRVDYLSNSVYAGELTTSNVKQNFGSVSHNVYKGVEGKDYRDPGFYTFNDYSSAMSDIQWSTHTWKTNGDSAIVDYISSGFYNFVLNENLDGWAVSLEMAADYPVDVTSEYVGKFGITSGEKGRAWKIEIRDDLYWENNEPITIDDFIYGYQELLNPLMKNNRASSLFSGVFQIVNAKEYYYSGQVVNTENYAGQKYEKRDLQKHYDGQYYTPDGDPVFIAIDYILENKLEGVSLKDYVDTFGTQYFDTHNWDELVSRMDSEGLIPLTDENYELFLPVITGNPNWLESEADMYSYYVVKYQYPEIDWSEVGIFQSGDNEITFVVTSEVDNPDCYVPYSLSSSYLVYRPLWEKCKSYYDANGRKVEKDSDQVAYITTDICTSVDTTMSYGPYKLEEFKEGEKYLLTRNNSWYGYHDGNHYGQYQADAISVMAIDSHTLVLDSFLKGQLDVVALQAEEMAMFKDSEYVFFEPQSYTTKLTMNTDLKKTTERGTQILTNINFRKALSLAIDTDEFASTLTTGTAGFGLLNTMYVYNPNSGATYRSTDGAKKAIVELNEMTYGEGGDYENLNAAYYAVTGYDLEKARQTMALAYDECVESGLYDGESQVVLHLHVYSGENIYILMYSFLDRALKNACEGTGFEGKVSLQMTIDDHYYDSMYSGNADMVFTTWGGAAYSPYEALFKCYSDASDGSGKQMEYGFDTSQILVTITVDGVNYTANLQNWAKWAAGEYVVIASGYTDKTLLQFNEYSMLTRAEFFGKLEYAYLSFYPTIPLYYRSVASLMSQKGQYASSSYIDMVGFGGLAFYTFNYADSEWKTVSKSGNLKY